MCMYLNGTNHSLKKESLEHTIIEHECADIYSLMLVFGYNRNGPGKF